MKTTQSGQIIHHDGGTSFNGPGAVDVFRAITIASALRLYARLALMPVRAYTPTAMLRVASEYLGHPFKRGQYQQAADELSAWAQQARSGMDIDARTQPERTTEPNGKPIDV